MNWARVTPPALRAPKKIAPVRWRAQPSAAPLWAISFGCSSLPAVDGPTWTKKIAAYAMAGAAFGCSYWAKLISGLPAKSHLVRMPARHAPPRGSGLAGRLIPARRP